MGVLKVAVLPESHDPCVVKVGTVAVGDVAFAQRQSMYIDLYRVVYILFRTFFDITLSKKGESGFLIKCMRNSIAAIETNNNILSI